MKLTKDTLIEGEIVKAGTDVIIQEVRIGTEADYWRNQMDDAICTLKGSQGMISIIFSDNSQITYRVMKYPEGWQTVATKLDHEDSQAYRFDMFFDDSLMDWLISQCREG